MNNPLTFIQQINHAVESGSKSAIKETLDKISETPSPYLDSFLRESLMAMGMGFVLEKDGDPIAAVILQERNATVSNLTSGYYSLNHSTGRCLWCANLQAEDLFLDASSGDLVLAASTEADVFPCSKEVTLLNGDLILRIIPGFKTGSIEIQSIH